MTEAEVVELVRVGAAKAGSLREYARQTGVTASYISDLLNGRRAPGPKILGPLGLERLKVIEYRPVKAKRRS